MTTTQLLNEIRSTDVPNVAPGLSQLVVLVVWQLAAAGLIVAQTPSAVANPARSFPPPSAFDLSNPAFRATEQPSRDRLLYLGLTGIPPLTSSASPPISQTRRAPQYQGAFANTSTWLRDLTLESFGIGLGTGALMTGIDRSPGYFVSLFDHHGMECPGCAVGPLNRPFTLPAFGANATLKPRYGRTEYYAGIGGVQALRPAATIINDAWVAQAQLGARFSLDRSQRFWLGGVGRYFYNFGPDPKRYGANPLYMLNVVPFPKRGFGWGGNALIRLGR